MLSRIAQIKLSFLRSSSRYKQAHTSINGTIPYIMLAFMILELPATKEDAEKHACPFSLEHILSDYLAARGHGGRP